MFPPSAHLIKPREVIQHGKLRIDAVRYIASFEEHPLELSQTEFALLACLAQAAPQVVPFVELTQQIPTYVSQSAADARRALRHHIHRLRRKLKEVAGEVELIETVRSVGYVLSPHPYADHPSGIVTFLFSDVEGSTELWDQHSQKMTAALKRHDTLLRESFMRYSGFVFKTVGDGFYVAFARTSDAFAAALAAQRALHAENWPEPTRLRVRMALSTGAAEMREDDYYGTPLNLAARLLSAGHGGQILLEQTTRAEIVDDLPPSVEIRDMGSRRFKGFREPQQVFQAIAADLPAHFPPLRTLDPRPTNLPAELTSFVGREGAMREIGALLRRAEVRLVTLTGAGGIGKTRLSLQIASSLQDEYEDGVFFVTLAAIHDPALLPFTIALALGVQESSDSAPIKQIITYLRNRHLLLVLDNFEHIVEAAPIVNDLLRGAPNLKVLVTSREALLIYGEYLYPVMPLALPDSHKSVTLGQLDHFAATSLFVQRVQARVLDLTLEESDAPVIVAICTSLDGLPLAIELAAARAGQFSLADIAAQLTHRLGFLTTGPRDLPTRQRTLRGALDWSYELLTPDEQVLFARLAVFVGGWDMAAAHQLVAEARSTPGQIAATLTSLAAKSLVQYQPGQTQRYFMLETIREYAWERLHNSPDLDAMRQRHAAYYRKFVVESESKLTGDQSALLFKTLQTEVDNLRATLAWSLEQEGDETALEMCGVLWRWWAAHSYLSEGRSWLERVLTCHSVSFPSLRAKALWGAGRLAFFQTDYAVAEEMLKESLTLYRRLGDEENMAWVLDAIGATLLRRKEYAQARQLFEESLALHRATGNRRGISHTLDDLGKTAFWQGDIEQAVHLFGEALKLRRESGSPEGTAVAIVNLSEALSLQGEYGQAETLLQEALQIYQQLVQPSGVIMCLSYLGQLKGQTGEFQEAVAYYTKSLNFLEEVEQEEKELVAESLFGLAESLLRMGKEYEATQVLSAVKNRLDTVDPNLTLHNQYTPARTDLNKTAWDQAWGEGQAMSLREIIALISPQEAV